MFDRAAIATAIDAHGPVMRVVICSHQGSSPREAGAAMLVWADPKANGGQSGTIGGGTLEYEASVKARAMLGQAQTSVERIALGPNLGQCCGGAVVLAYEYLDTAALSAIPENGLHVRPVARDAAAEPPLAIRRALKTARGQGVTSTRFVQGWLAEPVAPPTRALWVWGAGHVGRAIVTTLAPLPDLSITWIDTDRSRFPASIPEGVTLQIAENPASLSAEAPENAEHLILTYSHALDLDLCHRILMRGFARCGLIGSASKWARFRNRLQALGHDPAQIARIDCPIGDPALGKHPQAIAISVASAVLSQSASASLRKAI